MLGERAQMHDSRGRDDQKQSMSNMPSMLHHSVAINAKGGDF
jgi:hypothetical protein